MMVYDTNGNGSINLEDDVEYEHLSILMEYCDYNNDDHVDTCEIHDCIVDCENAWRAEYCPEGYAQLYCNNPYTCATCPDAWNCEDVYTISV